jgi:beta-lactamase class A
VDLTTVDLPGTARWSIAVRDATDGALLGTVEPDQQLRTASIGKIFLLLEVARQIEGGELGADEVLERRPDEWVEDSGVWHLLAQPQLSVGDLAVLVGAFSDNLATNVLVRRVGIPAVRRTSERLGCRRSALLDRVRLERTPDLPPTLSVGTADELSEVMVRLHHRTAVSPGVSDQVLRWLAANTDLSMVAAAFDLDPLAHRDPDRGVRLANKTGAISTARADVGLVAGPAGTVAYAVLASWEPDADPRTPVLAAMRTIGERLRRCVEG